MSWAMGAAVAAVVAFLARERVHARRLRATADRLGRMQERATAAAQRPHTGQVEAAPQRVPITVNGKGRA